MERKEGYYFVKKNGIWDIGYYNENGWNIIAHSHTLLDEYFDEIDTRLIYKFPDEYESLSDAELRGIRLYHDKVIVQIDLEFKQRDKL